VVISHRHRYLYFVVPKCASATVRQSLAPLTDVGYPVTDDTQHVTIRKFLESGQRALFDAGYLRFTFVRHPYDRLFSGYVQDRFAATQSPRWRHAKQRIFDAIGDDFNRYVMEHVRKADREGAWQWICWCPMHAFAYLDGECVVDFVGRAEAVDLDPSADPDDPCEEAFLPTEMDFPLRALWEVRRPGPRLELYELPR